MTRPLIALGDTQEARAIGVKILADAAAGRASTYCVALVDANLDDFDGAFAALDAEVSAHNPTVDGLLPDFHLRALHNDPRWGVLISRVGLAPYLTPR